MGVEYPEHEKLTALGDEREHVQDFLDWLYDVLGARIVDGRDREIERTEKLSFPGADVRARLMAEFFGINLDVLDAEKKLMLDLIRGR